MSPIQSRFREPAAPLLGKNKHESTVLKTPGGFFVEIDNEMVEIIQHLWSRGYITQFCCENLSGSERAQIIFATMTQAVELLRKLMDIDDRLGWRNYAIKPMMAIDGGELRAELTWKVRDHEEIKKVMLQV